MMASNAANGGMLVPQATQIETASGRFVDTLNPEASAIDIADIAHHLSLLCRYGGAVNRFYSVAEHAVLVHDLAKHMGETQLDVLRAALLHDAAEAYLGDMVSPLKYALRRAEFDYPGAIHRASAISDFTGAYSHLTDRMNAVLAERFEIGPAAIFDIEAIKVADMWALRIEAEALTHSRGVNWRWPGELPEGGRLPAGVAWAGGLPWRQAKRLFIERAAALGLGATHRTAGEQGAADG